MSYLDKVAGCNRRNMRHFLPFYAGPQQVGWVTPARLEVLAGFPKIFHARTAALRFNAALATPTRRSKALAEIAEDLVATGLFPRLRGELYAVKNYWSEPAWFRIDRGLVQAFGVHAYGVHVNGVARKAGELQLWIGTRARDLQVEPGKLDNMVGGGQPAGLSLMANLVKECDEEAHLGAKLARTARFASTITYAFETPDGLKVDTLYNYDLVMPAGTAPRVSDEIVRFQLMPMAKALAIVRATKRFKFNVNLVILDFAIRHGLLTPETTRDFDAIVAGLHERPLYLV